MLAFLSYYRDHDMSVLRGNRCRQSSKTDYRTPPSNLGPVTAVSGAFPGLIPRHTCLLFATADPEGDEPTRMVALFATEQLMGPWQ